MRYDEWYISLLNDAIKHAKVSELLRIGRLPGMLLLQAFTSEIDPTLDGMQAWLEGQNAIAA
jgi:hypothetical protein